MGLVYLGRSEAGRTVAVKVVQAEHAQNPEFRRRFAREVAAAQRVGGSWTAAVLDADTDAAMPWVATQYIPGPDLTTVVRKDFGPLPENSVRVLANRLALALQAVHEAGLIHRDLKPSNVLVTVDGPRVIDFGIARAMETLVGESLLTHTGMLIGSPGFMSPEQVRGLELTPASDVFCLGAVLVYAATGRLLFGAGTTGLHAHLFRVAEEEADLTGIPESLLDLVRECLDKDQTKRPTLQQIVARTAEDTDEEWLPGAVLAKLGRHAAQLLDYAPETSLGTPSPSAPAAAPPPPADPRIPSGQPQSSVPPPPAYTPTPGPHSAPSPEFGPPAPTAPPPPRSRWWGLAAIALTQLLVLLDATSDALWWALDPKLLTTVYALAFGVLLPLGGHLADLVGRKRMLIIGLSGSAAAAMIGGVSRVPSVLILARALEGAFAALLVPATLALVAGHFTDPKARGKAFGVYAAIAAGASTVSLFTGEWLYLNMSWHWSMYANVLIALIALICAAIMTPDSPARTSRRVDVPGLLLGSGGIVALVFGFRLTDPRGWTDLLVLVLFAVGGVLLLAFAWWQTRAAEPLLPFYVFKDRNRIGSLLTLLLVGVGTAALLPTLKTYLESINAFPTNKAVKDILIEPTKNMLPMVAAIVVGSTQVSARLLHRISPRILIVSGLLLTALGLWCLTLIKPDGTYATGVLPGMLLAGLGIGMALMPLFSIATAGIAAPDAGGSATAISMAHQVGGALGAPLFSSVLASAVAARMSTALGSLPANSYSVDHGHAALSLHQELQGPPQLTTALKKAIQGGYADALWWPIGITLLAALVAAVLIRSTSPSSPEPTGPTLPLLGRQNGH